MGIFKRLTLDYRKSIYTKVLLSILIALMVIIFLMEMSNFYVLKQYSGRKKCTRIPWNCTADSGRIS